MYVRVLENNIVAYLVVHNKKNNKEWNNNVMQNTSPEFLLFQVDANN